MLSVPRNWGQIATRCAASRFTCTSRISSCQSQTPSISSYFLQQFGQVAQGDQMALNRQLLLHLRGLPKFDGFDSQQMMRFLYDSLSPKAGTASYFGNPDLLNERLALFAAFAASPAYAEQERTYKDNLLAALGRVLADSSLD